MLTDLSLLFKAYLVLLGLQFIGLPWVWKRGFSLARGITILSVALAVWFAGHVIPINTDLGVGVFLLIYILCGIIYLKKSNLKDVFKILNKNKWILIVEEILFAFGFFGLSIIRGFNPDILGLEKFMDYGFVKSYLTHAQLPAPDMWLAGSGINYYSFGHFIASIAIRIMGVVPQIGYNLVLGLILGFSLSLSFEIVVRVFGKVSFKTMLGGIVGALMVSLGGNSHLIWYLFQNMSFTGYWYPNATRFVERTIHEFPAYSFVVSDLHGHVLDLPVVLSFLLILTSWKGKWKSFGTLSLGILLGVMAMTNTWDLLIYGLILVVYGANLMATDNNWLISFKNLLISALIMSGLIIIVAGPWYLNFEPISNEVKLASEHSPAWQLMVLWGGHLVVTVVALIVGFKKKNLFILCLGITAIILLILPEIVYVKDIYLGHPRANTMFKLTYQSFVMMSLLSGIVFTWLVNYTLKKFYKLYKIIGLLIFMVFFGGVMTYPYIAFKTFYGLGFSNYRGLDGISWINKKSPGEAWVIWYLGEKKIQKNIVEAVGDSYTEFNAISAYSGVPTIVGWRVHEWLWRGGYDIVSEKGADVAEIYEGVDVEKARKILKYNNVGFIVLGEKERQEYKVDEKKILKLGKIVLNKGGVKLIEVY
jgi:uncharacterized membrane protein